MAQLRIQSDSCSQTKIREYCFDDYSNSNKDEEYFSTIVKAFEYQRRNGNRDGYIYEFRGRLSEMKSNLFLLHQLS